MRAVAARSAVVAAAAAATLAACSSGSPGTTAATSSPTTTTSSTTQQDTLVPDTSPATTTGVVPTPTAVAVPTTFVSVDKLIQDPDLGHQIKVLRLARDLPWPPSAAAEAQAFELVGVEMTWTPGVTYTASLRTVDFSLASTSTYPNRPDAVINPGLQAAGWTILPAEMPNGQTGTGWIVFKVDSKAATSLRLDYTRPASRVTDSGQTFPKTVFSAQLVG